MANKGMVKFLEDKKNTCSSPFIIDDKTCIGFNKKRIFNKDTLTIIAGISGNEKQIIYLAEKVKIKKIQNRFYTYDIDANDINVLSKFERLPLEVSISECVCSNVITKVEYNFYVNKTEITDYETIYYVEDVKDRCNTKKNLDLSFEINFRNYNKVNKIL
jgi:hypothetical protein